MHKELNDESKALIELHEFDGLGLIVKFSTGIIYTNQTGGFGCFHPEVEGFFVPLPTKVGKSEITEIQRHFTGDWHCINADDEKFLNSTLKKYELGYIQVDSALLKESYEAWVHIEIEEHQSSPIRNFGNLKGILTWLNSD